MSPRRTNIEMEFDLLDYEDSFLICKALDMTPQHEYRCIKEIAVDTEELNTIRCDITYCDDYFNLKDIDKTTLNNYLIDMIEVLNWIKLGKDFSRYIETTLSSKHVWMMGKLLYAKYCIDKTKRVLEYFATKSDDVVANLYEHLFENSEVVIDDKHIDLIYSYLHFHDLVEEVTYE